MHRFVLALLVIAPSLAAAEPGDPLAGEKLSIDQLLDTAVRRSSTLVFVRSSLRQSALAVKTAGAGAELRVQASAGLSTKQEPLVANGQPGAIGTTNLTGAVGLAKQIVTGADLSLGVDTVRQVRRAGDTATAAVLTTVGVEVRQPLLRGIAQGAHVDERKAHIAADASKLQAIDDSGALVLDLLTAYWELAYAHATLGVREQSLELAQSQLELTRKMHERGTVPDSAIKSARYGVALREEAKLRAQDALRSASIQLRKLAGLEIATDLGELVPTDALKTSSLDDDAQAAVAEALAHNPRIAAARLGITIAEVELKRRRNAALPAIDLSANANLLGAGADQGGALQGASSGGSYEVGGALTFRWEAGGAARAAAESARIDRSDAKVSAKDVERDVVAGVIEIVGRLSAAKQRAVVAERAIELANANLDTEVALFRADKSSNYLVFERQTELDEARLLASRAAADALIARATLEYLTGTLLDRYGIEVMSSTKGTRHAVPVP